MNAAGAIAVASVARQPLDEGERIETVTVCHNFPTTTVRPAPAPVHAELDVRILQPLREGRAGDLPIRSGEFSGASSQALVFLNVPKNGHSADTSKSPAGGSRRGFFCTLLIQLRILGCGNRI